MKVSVVVVTYNHATLIEQALQSVFDQRTTFETEVIISEDASTDGTRAIVERWRARYPARVRLLLSEHNLRSNEVVARGFRAARGEYVALLDGDDYWTSERKLEKQAAVLDAHAEAVLCFHDAELIDDTTGTRRRYTPPNQCERVTLDDFWGGNPFATCTSMFRRAALSEIPSWYAAFFPITDWPLYVLFARHGDGIYLPEAMGAYRVHTGGLYSAQPSLAKLHAVDSFYRLINGALDFCYDPRIRAAHRRYFFDWAQAYRVAGRRELARASFALGRSYDRPRTPHALLETATLWASLHAPWSRRRESSLTRAR